MTNIITGSTFNHEEKFDALMWLGTNVGKQYSHQMGYAVNMNSEGQFAYDVLLCDYYELTKKREGTPLTVTRWRGEGWKAFKLVQMVVGSRTDWAFEIADDLLAIEFKLKFM